MTDPVTGAIVKAGVSTAAGLGKRVFEAVNGARSSVKMEREIAELLAEEAGERQRELEAAAIAKEVALVLLELHDGHGWSDEPEEERPTEDDALSAAVDLIRQARRAGSNRKRKVLFHAFYMRFSPEFYKDGMGKMLWQIACDLEYPTMRALKEIAEVEEAAKGNPHRSPTRGSLAGARVQFNSDLWPYVGSLEDHGLLANRNYPDQADAFVHVTTRGRAFMRFALDEYRERGDATEAVTEE